MLQGQPYRGFFVCLHRSFGKSHAPSVLSGCASLLMNPAVWSFFHDMDAREKEESAY
jgi:hypothetical protein